MCMEDDVKNIMDSCWRWGSTMMFLKRWTPFFYAFSKRLDITPIWINIIGLPIEFWSYEVFKEIGNSLGVFYEANMIFEETRIMTIVWILVGIDLRDGLALELVLQKGNLSITQALYYSGVPFKCV